jgi:hypothetical protein
MFRLLRIRRCVGRVRAVTRRHWHYRAIVVDGVDAVLQALFDYAGWIPRKRIPSIASRSDAVVIKPFLVHALPFQRSQQKFCVDEIVVDLYLFSGNGGSKFRKSLEFFEEAAVYADFAGRNREDFPDRNHRFRERLHKTKVIGAWSKIGGEGNLHAY